MRGIHVGELREAIDALRVSAGLARAWSNPQGYAALTGFPFATYIQEMQNRLNEARGALTFAPLPFEGYVAAGAPIRAGDLMALRAGVK